MDDSCYGGVFSPGNITNAFKWSVKSLVNEANHKCSSSGLWVSTSSKCQQLVPWPAADTHSLAMSALKLAQVLNKQTRDVAHGSVDADSVQYGQTQHSIDTVCGSIDTAHGSVVTIHSNVDADSVQ